MHKTVAAVLSALLSLMLLAGCSGTKAYKDGSYRAEFQNYDSRGYKDFLEITVEDTVVTSILFNAVSESGLYKNDDSKYQEEMDAVQGTYPARFSQDLVNQYLETHKIDDVDTIAGATYSTESFLALFKALEPQMTSGNTETLVVENISEK